MKNERGPSTAFYLKNLGPLTRYISVIAAIHHTATAKIPISPFEQRKKKKKMEKKGDPARNTTQCIVESSKAATPKLDNRGLYRRSKPP